ncbi:MAG: restriction endonuclease subunit S [Bacteroidia bacterium]|nr:restriction endonuclease subunit S [Bacteroidia bacterium]
MSEWKEYKLSEFVQFGNGKERPKTEGDIPVFGGNGVLGYCDKSNYDGETIIIGRVGAYCGSVYYQNKPIWVSDNALAARPKNNSNAKFLYYFLKNIDLNSFAEGSSHPLVTQTLLNSLDIFITDDLSIQTAIAEVLSSLDDKIDLLHRQNKTLEQLAETLFRQWFVEEAEESWEEATIRDIAEHSKESINPSKNPERVFHHFSLPSFDEGKNPKAEIGKDILSNKYKVIPNSILISKLNPRFPRIWGLYGDEIPENAICSTEFQIVKPKDTSFFGFIFCFLKSNQVTQELANAAGGTSGSHQRVNPDDIFNLSFLLPPIELIERFHIISNEHLKKIKSNTQQIRTLTQLRDSLLPKLMSGEVRVSERVNSEKLKVKGNG